MAASSPIQPIVAADEIDEELLKVVVGLLVDAMWWLDTCFDDEVDLQTAVRQVERATAVLDDLPDPLKRRLVHIVRELTATELRREQSRLFLCHTGLVDEEPDDDAPPGPWVHPAVRLHVVGPSQRTAS